MFLLDIDLQNPLSARPSRKGVAVGAINRNYTYLLPQAGQKIRQVLAPDVGNDDQLAAVIIADRGQIQLRKPVTGR